MTAIQITTEEFRILKDYLKRTPLLLIRLKTQALLFSSKGVSTKIISEISGRKISTINLWISDWKSRRLSSIFTGHKNNQNAALLTLIQKNEIKLTLEKPPNEYDLTSEFWNLPTLKAYTQATFGTVYESDQSYYYLLKFCGYSFKYPDKQSPNRGSDLEISTRTIEIRNEIARIKQENPETIIFTADETRLQYQSEIRKAWLKKGEKTIVKTQRDARHQNYFGFLNNDTGECLTYEIERGNTEETIRVLQALKAKYPIKKLCVIWDNAAWHRSKLLQIELSKNGSLNDLHLIKLPPYAPETNPIEHVWKWAKDQISNRSSVEWEGLKNEFEGLLKSRVFEYKI